MSKGSLLYPPVAGEKGSPDRQVRTINWEKLELVRMEEQLRNDCFLRALVFNHYRQMPREFSTWNYRLTSWSGLNRRVGTIMGKLLGNEIRRNQRELFQLVI